MKKVILIAVLILLVVSSVVTGTLAIYSIKLDELSGDTVAKQFAFSTTGDDRYINSDIKIAPCETVDYLFKATNYQTAGNSKIISEVNMLATFKVSMNHMINKDGTLTEVTPIKYLIASLYDADTNVKLFDMNLTDGISTTPDEFSIKFTANTTAERNFKIVITWVPHEDDILYSTSKTLLKINAHAEQITDEVIVLLPNGVYMTNRPNVTANSLSDFANKYVNDESKIVDNAVYMLSAFNCFFENINDSNYYQIYNKNGVVSYPNWGSYEGYYNSPSASDANTAKKGHIKSEVFTTLLGSYQSNGSNYGFSDLKIVMMSNNKVGGVYIKLKNNKQIIYFADGTVIYDVKYSSIYSESTTYLTMMQNGKFEA